MSTVQSIETYCQIRGISEEVTLVESGSNDWELVVDCVGQQTADEYSSALLYCADSEVKLIWGIYNYTPLLTSHALLIFSQTAYTRETMRQIERRRK